MNRVAAEVAAASFLVPTLSLDEPINALYPWRWFCAGGWHATAVMHAMTPPHRPAVRRVAEVDPA